MSTEGLDIPDRRSLDVAIIPQNVAKEEVLSKGRLSWGRVLGTFQQYVLSILAAMRKAAPVPKTRRMPPQK